MKSFRIVSAFLLACLVAPAQQYEVSTVAGIGSSPGWSGDGGPATQAQLNSPIRVRTDKAGNLYITDYSNYSVRKVRTDGTIDTVAGSGRFGFAGDGDTGRGATLSNILDVVVDPANGDIFIADSLNSRIRRVTAAGAISTYAGNGSRGFAGDGGAATDAALYFPAGLALDAAGNLYVADYGNATVRKIDRNTRVISTVAGVGYSIYGGAPGDNGPATSAFLSQPFSIGFDGAGNLYIGDTGTSTIRRVDTNGVIRTYLDNFVAQNFAVDAAGNLYVAEYRTNTVQKVLPGGTRLWIGGNGTSGYAGDGNVGTSAQFSQPYGVAVDDNGNVFVADAANAVVRKLSPIPVSIGAVANAASLDAFAPPISGLGDASRPIAPGEIVVLYGAGIGPATLVSASPSNGQFPKTLAGTTVTFNGTAAPLIYSSANAVAAIVPYSVNGLGNVDIRLNYQNRNTPINTVPVGATAPGIFTADTTGSGQAAALNQAGTLNGPANPAQIGSVIVLYLTGEGQTTPNGVDGKIAAAAPYPAPVQPVKVSIGGFDAVVNYAGAAPTLVAGAMQINAEIPAGITPGAAVPVIVTIGGVRSRTATIAVTR
ncbi:MAG: repeat containing protein [Bryobacterales bacterium]|nr:repeat containing protein [Bryobacterales bacterium]